VNSFFFVCCQTISCHKLILHHLSWHNHSLYSYQSIWLYHWLHYLIALSTIHCTTLLLSLPLITLSGCCINTCHTVCTRVLCYCETQIAVCLHLLSWSSKTLHYNYQSDYRCILKVSKQLRDLLESNNWLRLGISVSLCEIQIFGEVVLETSSMHMYHG